MSTSSLPQFGKNLLHSVWFFPFILFLGVALLTSLKISGSSIGVYHQALYGSEQRDPDLIFGQPRPIRSDEWIINTQMTVAQSNAGFPRINHNIGEGRDMSLLPDAPYREWSTVFRPLNLIFFILPLEHAFAFRWWLMLYLLIVSCYFFVLRLFPNERLFASIFATAVGLSPFVSWWYLSGTMAPLFYGFFIMILGIRVIDGERTRWLGKRYENWASIIYILALAYLLTAFALILYPPFQIPIAIGVTAFLTGYLMQKLFTEKTISTKDLMKRVSVFVLSAILAGSLVFVFIKTRAGAVSAITNTVYPGARVIKSGGLRPLKLFSSFLQPQLQRTSRAVHFYDNQSEASNFLLLSPFLLLPGLALIFYEYRRRRRVDWVFVAVQACFVALLVRAFVPQTDFIFKPLLLDKVPHDRLLIGFGFIGVLHILYIIKKIAEVQIKPKILNSFAFLYSISCFIVLLWTGFFVQEHYPKFITSPLLIIFLALVFTFIIACFLSRKTLFGSVLFLLFSIGSVGAVHPLYRGLGILAKGDLSVQIQSVSRPEDTWATLDDLYFQNFGFVNNRDSITGIQFYPDVNFWRQLDGERNDYIYNRFAHVIFNSDPAFTDKIRLIQPDHFQVKFGCSDFVLQKVDFVLSPHILDFECTGLVKVVDYPVRDLFIYRVTSTD